MQSNAWRTKLVQASFRSFVWIRSLYVRPIDWNYYFKILGGMNMESVIIAGKLPTTDNKEVFYD